ncbi:glycosyltransferase family 4 protein [Sulfurovum sp.]|uniref:glycosyltransferase family 4 protein n=1 Tax=Sulfurovum sp. TaxID=1969726 RepID=UPI0035699626
MKICFVHMHKVEDEKQLEFLGNILLRVAEVFREEAEIHFLYNGDVESNYLLGKNILTHKYGDNTNGGIDRLVNPVKLILEIRKICKDNKIDIVLNLSDHYYFFWICIGAKIAGAKCIARIAGIIAESEKFTMKRRIFKLIGKLLERISLSMADHVLCLSNSLKNLLVQRDNNINKMTVISQGVDVNFFVNRELKQIKKSPQRLLFVGRVVKYKGIYECIDAFLNIRELYPDIELVICGHGHEKDALSKKYQYSGIIFKDYVSREKLNEEYLSADVLLLPSYSEGMPNVILEAMSCKVPVIASRTGEIPNLLKDGRGILVEPRNVNEIIEALKTIIEDVNFRLSCVQKAHEYVLRHHSYEIVRKKTIELFSSVITKC